MSFLLNQAIYPRTLSGQDASQSDTSIYDHRESLALPPASIMSYELPTLEQLRNSDIRIECSPGVVKRIEPTINLYHPIEDYLPPSGPYFDYYALDKIFGPQAYFSRKDPCLSCWKRKHAQRDQACVFLCLVCQTKHHIGAECDALYVKMKFWKERGHIPPAGVQIHPCASEFAYLAVAGIFKPAKRLWDPIIVNMEHPVARQFYKDRDEPEPLMRQVEVPRKKKMQAQQAVQIKHTTLRAVVSEDQPQIKQNSNTVDQEIQKMTRELADLKAKLKKQASENAHHRANNLAVEEALDENVRLKERIAHLETKNGQLEERNAHLEHIHTKVVTLLIGTSLEDAEPGEKRQRRDGDVGQRDS